MRFVGPDPSDVVVGVDVAADKVFVVDEVVAADVTVGDSVIVVGVLAVAVVGVLAVLPLLFTTISTLTFTKLSCISTLFTLCLSSSSASMVRMMSGCSDPRVFVLESGIGSVAVVAAMLASVADSVADSVSVVAGFVVPPGVALSVAVVASELALKQPVVVSCWECGLSHSQSVVVP